jgi:hypothetical protein
MSGTTESTTKTTRDHDEIRRWAEARGAKPVRVKETGVIELDFPGYEGGDRFEEISWDDWFRVFDERGLTLQYQDETAGGEQSNWHNLVRADGS